VANRDRWRQTLADQLRRLPRQSDKVRRCHPGRQWLAAHRCRRLPDRGGL